MKRRGSLQRGVIGGLAGVVALAGVAGAANVNVGVDVTTPNVRVRASNLPAPPPPVTVIERERVIVREKDGHHDRGRHRGHDKRHKKHTHHDD